MRRPRPRDDCRERVISKPHAWVLDGAPRRAKPRHELVLPDRLAAMALRSVTAHGCPNGPLQFDRLEAAFGRPDLGFGPQRAASVIVRILFVVVLVVFSSLQAYPQSDAKPPDQTATPPATQQSQTPTLQNPPSVAAKPIEDTLAILAKKSYFFPDLAVNRRVLTTRQKLELATSDAIAPSTLIEDAVGAGLEQAFDAIPEYGQGWSGYGKRYGTALLTGATNQYFKTFLIPTVAHQDPRYFVLLHDTTTRRIAYALTRVVVARTDRGVWATNWGGIFGPLMAQGLANAYLPGPERTAGKTFRRYGVDLALSGGANVIKEYWPTIFRKLQLKNIIPPTVPNPADTEPNAPK
jgi:hypothetical protein